MTTAAHQVDRLRVRATGGQGLACQLALTRLLATADWQPPAMPPAATLIVRSLADPLPGRLAPARPAARVDSGWEQALQQRLAALYAAAARPGRGPVPVDAAAVRFDDPAELLACLLLDLQRREAGQRWWWQALLRGLPTAAAGMTRLLCRQAVQVPAVLWQLHRQGQVLPVLRALAPEQARAVLVAMSRAHTLPALIPASAEWSPASTSAVVGPAPPLSATSGMVATAVPLPAGAGDSDSDRPPTADTDRDYSLPPPPWQPWLPAALSLTGLSREQAGLLGVGLTLYQVPAVVHGAGFQRRLHAWWSASVVATVPPVTTRVAIQSPPEPPSSSVQPAAVLPAMQPAMTTSLAAVPPASTSVAAPLTPTTVVPASPRGRLADASAIEAGQDLAAGIPLAGDPTAAPVPPVAATVAPPARLPPATVMPEAATAAMLAADVESVVPATTRLPPATAVPDAATVAIPSPEQAAITWRLEQGVTTRLAGVWYLLNLMLQLDLPDCFADGWQLPTRLGGWGTLAALARGLLAADDTSLLDDPLWPALAELSGQRPDQPLGADLPENADYRLPTAWFIPPGSGERMAYAWAATGRRLRLWSSQGYPLVEVATAAVPTVARARSELGRYPVAGRLRLQRRPFAAAPLAGLDGPLLRDVSPALIGWLAQVVPYLRWRLRRALATTGQPGQAGNEDWLFQEGHLYVTTTHLDLVLSLDAASLPIRLAGLDRDPGWLPTFGRVVRFHFDCCVPDLTAGFRASRP